MTAAGVDRVVVATGAEWHGLDALQPWLDGDDRALGRRVTIRGAGKAALSLALHATMRGHEVRVVTAETVLAPELGLPGRFRLVADCRAAGVVLELGVDDAAADADGDADAVVVLAPRAARPSWVDGLAVPVHVIGDASGRIGLESGLRAAADLVSA